MCNQKCQNQGAEMLNNAYGLLKKKVSQCSLKVSKIEINIQYKNLIQPVVRTGRITSM